MKNKEELNSDLENIKKSNDAEEVHESLPDASIELKDQVAKLEAELTESKDKYLRLYSEFENFKKRKSRETTELSKYASADVILSFLPVMDDLERASKSSETVSDSESIRNGIRLIFTKFKTIAESKGLKEMVSVNNSFDPDLHDAIANIPSPSEDMKGKIVEEIEKGYYLNDKVIRHAKVIVGN